MKKILLTLSAVVFCLSLSKAQKKADLTASLSRGLEIYSAQCIACHMENGEGLEGVYPPLAKSDYLMADKKRSLVQIVKGLSGPITVNGSKYDSEMIALELTDQEVSDVANYIRNSWGNKGEAVRPEEVKAIR